MRKFRKVIWVLPFIVLFAAACGSSSDSGTSNTLVDVLGNLPSNTSNTAGAEADNEIGASNSTNREAPTPPSEESPTPPDREDLIPPSVESVIEDDFEFPMENIIYVVVDEDNIEVTPPESNPDLRFSVDDPITIQILSTISEEVHIHGYDDTFFINDSAPALESYTFFAGFPGQFLVELEMSAKKLFEFSVS